MTTSTTVVDRETDKIVFIDALLLAFLDGAHSARPVIVVANAPLHNIAPRVINVQTFRPLPRGGSGVARLSEITGWSDAVPVVPAVVAATGAVIDRETGETGLLFAATLTSRERRSTAGPVVIIPDAG